MSMQLDDYRIAIRERNYPDLLDLALRVSRAHAGPLFRAFLVGVVPCALFNAWLLSGYVEPDIDLQVPLWYVVFMLMLVAWQIPLATAPMTLYLGSSLFDQKPGRKELRGRFFAALPQMFIFQVVLRGMLTPPVITLFVFFWGWPYLSEVILLERNPLFKGKLKRITTMRRVSSLHKGSTGDLFARWMGAMLVGLMFIISLWFMLYLLGAVLANQLAVEGIFYSVYFPVALWATIGYLTVVRFLSYLDLRIRREGWEVELLMRAESARLMKEAK